MPVPTKKNYYDTLGLTKAATEEHIKTAFRNLALQWHPDRHSKGKEEAARRFIEVNEAYRFLMDPCLRQWYDNLYNDGLEKKRGRAGAPDVEKDPSSTDGLKKSTSDTNATRPRAKSEPAEKSFAAAEENKASTDDLKSSTPEATSTRSRAKSDAGKGEFEKPAPAPDGTPSDAKTPAAEPESPKAGSQPDPQDHKESVGDGSTRDKGGTPGENTFSTPDNSDSKPPRSASESAHPRRPPILKAKSEHGRVPNDPPKAAHASSHYRTGSKTVPSSPKAEKTRPKSFGGNIQDFFDKFSGSKKQQTPTQTTTEKDSEPSPSKPEHPLVYDESDSDDTVLIHAGTQLHTTTVTTTGSPDEWIFPLPLTLEELYEGTSHRYRITRHLLSGKKKSIMVDIDIAPGWKQGTKIRFPGAGNERLGKRPQDVVFVVQEQSHDTYVREGSTLIARVPLPLGDALGGDTTVILKGLDGKKLEVNLPRGIIKPGDEFKIPGAGMPIRRRGQFAGKGDMIIRFTGGRSYGHRR